MNDGQRDLVDVSVWVWVFGSVTSAAALDTLLADSLGPLT